MNVEKQLTKNHSLLLGVDNIFNHKDEALSLPGTFVHVDLTMKL
jgi:outer membrane receptor for ferrienterochelin and colicins